MKVEIGPYNNWVGPWQIADIVFFWVDDNDISKENRWDHKLYTKFGYWLNDSWVNDFCTWIYEKKKRKVNICIDRYDTWSADHTLALIVVPLLKQLHATKHGAPFVDDEDVPNYLRSTNAKPKENEWDTDEFHHKRWDWVLEEMIWAFEEHCDEDSDLKIYCGKDDDREVAEKWQQRKSNGFRLFGKYYENLWD